MTTPLATLTPEEFELIDKTYPGLYDAIVNLMREQMRRGEGVSGTEIARTCSGQLSRKFGINATRIRRAMPYYSRLARELDRQISAGTRRVGTRHPMADAWIEGYLASRHQHEVVSA